MCAMSSNAPGPRPRQVTLAGWVIAVASAMLVATVFDAMARLRSVDTRDALTEALTTGVAKDLGLSVDDALGIVRVGLFVAALAAVVTGILGIFVLQRHAAARIVLTVAAVPVVLTAPFSGGVLALLIGGATVMLWSEPARDWFAGRAPRPAPAPRPERREAAPPQPSWTPPAPPTTSASQPAPTQGWGGQPVPPSAWPPPSGYAAPPPYLSPPAPSGRPTSLRVACILTWIFSSLTAALYLLVGAAVLVDRSRMLELLRDNPAVRDSKLDADQLVTVIVAVSVVVVLWCAAACGLAVLAWRRHVWAWIVLTVSVGVAALVEIAALPYSLLHLIAAGVALRMLLLAPTRVWFRETGAVPPSGPPPPHWPSPPGQHDAPPPPGDEPPSGKPPVW
jgi:hypothetical protein